MTSIGDSLTRQLLEARPFPALVIQVTGSQRKVVINRGRLDGVKVGQRFLVFGLEDEIIDPETHESLGKLEVLRGTGVVVHVQEKMATIESTRTRAVEKRVRTGDAAGRITYGFPYETVTSEPEELPFDYPVEGDLAKPI